MKKSFFILPLLLSACMSSGVKVDPEKLSQFQRGESTYGEVVQKLGKPSQTTIMPDGSKVITYTWISTQVRAETFIPIAGPFIGGADSENSSVSLSFDSDDVLKTYASSQGGTGVGNGFEAYSQPRNAQPDNAR